jgi:hypothetical protein
MYRASGDEALGTMEDLWQRVFATKSLEWRYEGERRLLIQTDLDDGSPIFLNYDRSAVREVVLGERMPAFYRQRLMAVLEEHHPGIPITTARRAHRSYSVVVD